MNQNDTLFTLVDDTPDFLIINKHFNVEFHKGKKEFGLCSIIRKALNCKELYPVHRLDTMTSGLIIFAKNKPAAQDFSSQFRAHTIEKYYYALGGTHPQKKQGTITGDMLRSRNGSWILQRTSNNPSITQFFSAGLGNGLRLYIIRPRTGRTHQIRVAMKSLGVPIYGDPLYFTHDSAHPLPDRGYLHAYTLRFKLNETQFCYQNVPNTGFWFNEDSTQKILKKFEEPWKLPWPSRI